MRRMLLPVLILALVSGSLVGPAAEAKRSRSRKATATYGPGSVGAGDVGGYCLPACASFATTKRERSIQVNVADASGQPVAFKVSQDLDDDGVGDIFNGFCGKSPKVPITGGATVEVFVWVVGSTGVTDAAESCPAVATTGEIVATFRK